EHDNGGNRERWSAPEPAHGVPKVVGKIFQRGPHPDFPRPLACEHQTADCATCNRPDIVFGQSALCELALLHLAMEVHLLDEFRLKSLSPKEVRDSSKNRPHAR